MLKSKRSSFFILCFALVAICTSCAALDTEHYQLSYIIDGDSLMLVDPKHPSEKLEVRLLGIDAPEYKQDPWGQRSREFLAELIGPQGSPVSLEFDIEEYDKYDRTLAYVYNEEDELVNEVMLEEGYAVMFVIKPNNRYLTRFKEAQAYAKNKELNIWDDEYGLRESPYKYRKRMSRKRRKAKN